MIEQNDDGAQSETRAKTVGRDTSMNHTDNPTQVSSSHGDIHTLEENVVSKVRSEVGSVMTTVESRIQDAVMTATENLVIPRAELAMKSVKALSGYGVGSVVLDPDRTYFSRKYEGLKMAFPSKKNHIYKKIGFTRLVVIILWTEMIC